MSEKRLTLLGLQKNLNAQMDKILAEVVGMRKDITTKVSKDEFETVIMRLEKDIESLHQSISKLRGWVLGGLYIVGGLWAGLGVIAFYVFQ